MCGQANPPKHDQGVESNSQPQSALTLTRVNDAKEAERGGWRGLDLDASVPRVCKGHARALKRVGSDAKEADGGGGGGGEEAGVGGEREGRDGLRVTHSRHVRQL